MSLWVEPSRGTEYFVGTESTHFLGGEAPVISRASLDAQNVGETNREASVLTGCNKGVHRSVSVLELLNLLFGLYPQLFVVQEQDECICVAPPPLA